MQLGSRLIDLLIDSAFVQSPTDQLADSPPDVRPAFRHIFKNVSTTQKYVIFVFIFLFLMFVFTFAVATCYVYGEK